MATAIFTASENSDHEGRIEQQYHFPKTVLGQATPATGELILQHEPRRNAGISRADYRQACFAVERLVSIEPESIREGHF